MLHRPNKTRAAKEGVIEPSAADLIRPFVAGPDTPPRYALHFGKVDKVGVNPKSEYDTPLAVCAYPLTEEIFDQFLRIDLPFAQEDAKYLFVLEIKPNARVFYSTEQFFDLGVGPEYLGADLSKIEVDATDDITIAEIREASFSEQFFYSTRPSNYALKDKYFVYDGTAARAAQWGHKLWKMGIDVWVDADNEGILHKNEPSQVMFFNPSSYRVVLLMDNPSNTLEARFGRDWRKRKGIDLTGAYLEDANLRDVDLRYANLTGADLIRADLYKAKLTGAQLTGAQLTRAILRDADLRDADLRGADLEDAKLHGAKLHGALLRGALLTRAILHGADLTDADLTGAYLHYAQYDDSTTWPDHIQVVLRVWRGHKNLRGADLRGADLRGANLNGADLSGADLTYAKLSGANLNGADLSGADLTYAKLTGAKLSSANLTDAILDGADLHFSDLTEANLTGANLTGADLSSAILDGIIYDDRTVWPDGFIPPPSAPRPNRR